MSSAYTSSASSGMRGSTWQTRLQDICRSSQLQDPVYNIISDRRGGRTAWSSTVTVTGASMPGNSQTMQARFWYDGAYIENAKEDAAEVAVLMIAGAGRGGNNTSTGIATTTASSNSGASYGVTSGIN